MYLTDLRLARACIRYRLIYHSIFFLIEANHIILQYFNALWTDTVNQCPSDDLHATTTIELELDVLPVPCTLVLQLTCTRSY